MKTCFPQRRILTVVSAAVLAFTIQTPANAKPETTFGFDDCFIPGVDEFGELDAFQGSFADSKLTEYRVRWVLKCETQVVNLSGSRQSYKGFVGGILLPDGTPVLTTDSTLTISASGTAKLKLIHRK